MDKETKQETEVAGKLYLYMYGYEFFLPENVMDRCRRVGRAVDHLHRRKGRSWCGDLILG
jgi:hypothetical protein